MGHMLGLRFGCLSKARLNVPRTTFNSIWRRQQSDKESGKTTVSVINKEIGFGLMIDAFSTHGFRLNYGFSVIGPIAIFPQAVMSWNIKTEHDITEDTLSLFHILKPKLDILVIGVGDKGNKIATSVVPFLSRKRIYVEVLPTETACTTYNFLCAEGRCVGGAMLPPSTHRTSEDDVITAKARDKQLFKISSWD